jgi:opacity protein-like surface antigen
MKKIILSTLCASILSTPMVADVFDNSKKGFILGGGLGYSAVRTNIDIRSNHFRAGATDTQNALATTLKLGYGISEQFSVFYVNDVSWYKYDGSSDKYITGASSIGVDYYFDENSPWYATGGIGIATLKNFTKNKDSVNGFSYNIGIGYEIMPHVTIEGKFLSNNFDDKNVDFDTKNFNLTFNYTWY